MNNKGKPKVQIKIVVNKNLEKNLDKKVPSVMKFGGEETEIRVVSTGKFDWVWVVIFEYFKTLAFFTIANSSQIRNLQSDYVTIYQMNKFNLKGYS